MKMRIGKKMLLLGGVAMTAAAARDGRRRAGPVAVDPRGWNYEIRDGKRVSKAGNRVTSPTAAGAKK